MQIPPNIEKEHLLKAIEKIDKDGYDFHAESSYYDVVYNGKRYPPKLVVSWANLFANNQILDRNGFSGGLNTGCFKLLEKNGFEIVKKITSMVDKLKAFSTAYKTEVELKHSNNLTSHKLLVYELPDEIRHVVSELGDNLIVKGSIGTGVNTFYPWIGIFDPKVSTGATNGFYVVILFSDDFEDIYLTFNQGATLQTKEQTEAYKSFVYDQFETIDGFEKERIPKGKLVKTKTGSATKNGKKYEETNIFYRHYKIDSLDENDFVSNLKKIVGIYIECADKFSRAANNNRIQIKPVMDFDYRKFYRSIIDSSIHIDNDKIVRFIASLLTKPFVILTGLSGSGKTKLAQAFALWICENQNQYCIVPVGADWINREPLLGFPNSLDVKSYLKPDNGILDLIMDASKHENQTKPYFLILDEMNLSHVERYFADFLSVMESQDRKGILLHSDSIRMDSKNQEIPNNIKLPANLFIIGTVNIDETTYMFSPKVLDRANVIEFRVTQKEMKDFFEGHEKINLENLEAVGAPMETSFISFANNKDLKVNTETQKDITETLLKFFHELKKVGAEFGYRSASEILRFGAIVETLETGWEAKQIIDAAIMQKLLPKLHGSRSKLSKVLITLGQLCLEGDKDVKKEFFDKHNEVDFENEPQILYRVSLEKISRMHKNVVEHGFTSYAEA